MTHRALLAFVVLSGALATACASSPGSERAIDVVRQVMVSPGARLVIAQLQCEANAGDDSLWTVSCEPLPDAEFQAKPSFHVNVRDETVTAANDDAQRLLTVSERLKGGILHECTLDEAIAGTLRLTCKK